MYASTTPTASAVLLLFVMWCSADIWLATHTTRAGDVPTFPFV
jgi:hypothetical protein